MVQHLSTGLACPGWHLVHIYVSRPANVWRLASRSIARLIPISRLQTPAADDSSVLDRLAEMPDDQLLHLFQQALHHEHPDLIGLGQQAAAGDAALKSGKLQAGRSRNGDKANASAADQPGMHSGTKYKPWIKLHIAATSLVIWQLSGSDCPLFADL